MTKARDLANLLSTSNGKIAGSNLDVSFENISDTGTTGTKVASGTTAQRGSTTGQWRYNTTTGFFEGVHTTGTVSIEPTPTVTSVDDGEVDSAGGGNQTIVVTGTNFISGAIISFVGSSASFNASTTTFNSATQVTAVAPKSSFLNAQEPYSVKIINPSGKDGTSATGLINVDNAPTWSTNSGALGNVYDNATGTHFTLSATDPEGDTVAYTETGATNLSGAGLSLNSSSGVISGDPTDVSGDTTVSFNVRATAGTKITDRTFNIIIKQLIGTSTNPATSSAQLYSAGITSDGNYYYNNTFTGGSARECYTRFNTRDGVHWHRWSPTHIPNVVSHLHGGGASTTTFTLNASPSLNSSTLSSSVKDFNYDTYNSGAGVSAIIDPKLQMSDLNGLYLGIETELGGIGDTYNIAYFGFDYASSTQSSSSSWGANYGSELALGYLSYDATNAVGTRNLFPIKFTANGSNTTYTRYNTAVGGGFGSTGSSDNLWSRYSNTSNAGYVHANSGTGDHSGDVTSSDYWALRPLGWSDNGNTWLSRGIFWIGSK